MEGDSAAKLAEIIPEINGPCVFWLDGHYSGGITGRSSSNCPLWDELDTIIKGGLRLPFLILIDDARCFGADPDYPSMSEVETFVRDHLPGYSLRVENDIIRICPAG